MKRDLFALLIGTADDVTLAELARALARPRRQEPIRVWRTFVRSGTTQLASSACTQRLRIVVRADVP